MKKSTKRSVRLPRLVVSLGRCVEVQFDDGRVWKTGKKRIDLCASESGKTLWVLGVSKERTSRKPKSTLYERFTGYLVSGVRTAKVREVSTLKRIGRVSAVVYASKKWTGKQTEYIHKFRKRPMAYSDNVDNPSFVKISGGKIRVKAEGITG